MDNRIEDDRFEKRGVETGLTGFVNYRPHVEMKDDERGLPGFLTESPQETVDNKNLPKIPLLIGMTSQETAKGLNLMKIKKSSGSYENFLKDLTSVVKLKELAGLITKPLNVLPLKLPQVSQYLSVPENLNPLNILARITEVTTDVLFNLPATVIADAWSQNGNAFLYQFDYAGKNAPKGSDILQGLPLVSDGDEQPAMQTQQGQQGKPPPVAHGDDLAYLFDISDVYGNPLKMKQQMTKEEQQVKMRYSKVITEFLRYSENGTRQSELFKKPFSSKGSSFIQIKDQLSMQSDFRFCALSLWGASPESSSGEKDCMSSLPVLSSVTQLVPKIPLFQQNKAPVVPIVNNLGGGGGGFFGLG